MHQINIIFSEIFFLPLVGEDHVMFFDWIFPSVGLLLKTSLKSLKTKNWVHNFGLAGFI